MRVLWPQHYWRNDTTAELDGLGAGLDAEFVHRFADVTDAQWRTCDAVVGPTIPLEYMDRLDRCRIFVKPGVGYDDVDIEALGALGIPVCNTPDYGTREVADHALALMLTLSKAIAFHDENLRADPKANWRPALNPFGQRLADQTFGVVGLGRIGTAAALRAKAFDMDVVFHDPYQPSGVEYALGVRRADSLDALMGQSDVVSVHTPLTEETRDLIGAAALAAARPGMILVNTARGPIVDIDALYEAMKADIVLAAGLDVLPDEPANQDKPLIKAWRDGEEWLRHRLVITPHSAFCTPQSMRDIRAFSARTAARYLREGRLENCVNQMFLKTRR
jgi:phosphoglycerate dehydrogenase-like enzyme